MFTILLAEDERSMRDHLARALERAGYAVVAVADGPAALAKLAEGGFGLLLTDIVMPGMDGIELAHRAAALHPAMRVMFITGFSAVTWGDAIVPEGAKILSKPFHLRDLVIEVARLLSRAEAMADG